MPSRHPLYPTLRVDAHGGAGHPRRVIARAPEHDRPRERLLAHGPEALADAELLALQLGTGRRGRSALDLARELLGAFGSLGELASRDPLELAGPAGLGRRGPPGWRQPSS